MTEETYDTIIGMPFYRLMPNGEIHNRYGKPIKFDKRGKRTMIIGGKVEMVKKTDILRCVAQGIDIRTIYPKQKSKRTPVPKTKQGILRRYNDICSNISIVTNAIITNDASQLLLHLYKRIPCYLAHFNYLDMDKDELRDILVDCVQELVEDVLKCEKVCVAFDRYVLQMCRTKLSKRHIETKNLIRLVEFQ